jgi:hypothetical protein
VVHVVGGIAAIVVAKTIFGQAMNMRHAPSPAVTMWLHPLLMIVGWLILLKAAVGFITGWGLLQREDWARTMALVIGFIALINIPLGTALGVYTLWVLLPAQSDDEYRALAQAA